MIEKFLEWRGLTTIISLLAIVFAVLFAWFNLVGRVGQVEKEHMLFGDQYKVTISEIKNSQLKTEDKVDRLIDRFISTQ